MNMICKCTITHDVHHLLRPLLFHEDNNLGSVIWRAVLGGGWAGASNLTFSLVLDLVGGLLFSPGRDIFF
jgi:hypothetical protein